MTGQLFAVDPGGTCGVAWAVFTGTGVKEPASVEVDPLEAAGMLASFARDTSLRPYAVACESFTPRPGVRTWQPDALYTIGALRYICYVNEIPLIMQTPAAAKRFSTNEKLAKLGWRNPTEGGHAEDALRHLLLLAVHAGKLDPTVFVES